MAMATKFQKDIMIEVLSRLPVESVLPLKFVCKSWCSVIKDPDLVKPLFLRNNNDPPSYILVSKEEFYFIDSIDSASSSRIIPKKLYLPFDSSELIMEIAGSCNGLLCLLGYFLDGCGFTLYLWNPATGFYKQIEPVGEFEDWGMGGDDNLEEFRKPPFVVCGFGCGKKFEDLKVLRISYFYVDHNNVDYYQSDVQVYSVNLGYWRSLGEIDYNIRPSSGKLVNGALHWIATRGNESDMSACILAFDLEEEVFREVPHNGFFVNGGFNMSLGVYKDCLCVFRDLDGRSNILVMEEYGVKDSWVLKFFIPHSLGIRDGSFVPLEFLQDDKLLYGKNAKQIALFNPKNGKVRKFITSGISYRGAAVSYVKSLVSVNAATSNSSKEENQEIDVKGKKVRHLSTRPMELNDHKIAERGESTVQENSNINFSTDGDEPNDDKIVESGDPTVRENSNVNFSNDGDEPNDQKIVEREDPTVRENSNVNFSNDGNEPNDHTIVEREDPTIRENNDVNFSIDGDRLNDHKIVEREDPTVRENSNANFSNDGDEPNDHKIVERDDPTVRENLNMNFSNDGGEFNPWTE